MVDLLSRPLAPGGPLHTRRDFVRRGTSTLAAASVLGLAGCGSKSSNSASTSRAASGASGALTIGMTNDLFAAFTRPGNKNRAAPFSRFTAEHGIKINVVTESGDTDTYFQQMRTQLEAGAAEVDLFAGDVSWPAQFGSQGWIADVADRFPPAAQTQFLPAAINAVTWNGKVFGVPFYWDDGYLFYRKDLLERAGYSGPPQTWAELQEMAEKVMRDDNLKYGFTFTGANYEGGTLLGMEFVASCGGSVYSGDTVSATSPEVIEGLSVARSMVTRGIAPSAVAEYQEGTVEGSFIAGNSVFLRNWTYMFQEIADPKQSKIHPSQVGVAAIPRASTTVKPVNVGGGWNLYINSQSKNQAEAWKLIQAMTSPAQQLYTFDAIQYNPTLTAVLDDPRLAKREPFSAPALATDVVSETIAPPKNPYYKDLSSAMAAQFQANLLGRVTPHQAAENLQTQLGEIIKRGSVA